MLGLEGRTMTTARTADISRGAGVLTGTRTKALMGGVLVAVVDCLTSTVWGLSLALIALVVMATDVLIVGQTTYDVPQHSAAARAVNPLTGRIDTDVVRRVLVATGQAKVVLRGEERHHEGTDLAGWTVTPSGDVH